MRISIGDAAAIESPVSLASQDVVYQSTVFTSLLNDAFQQRLADRMWAWVRPGGGVLWYDFTVNNPRNPDVRGVPVARVRELFPCGPITRAPLDVGTTDCSHGHSTAPRRCIPSSTHVPWLRTHVLAWIEKPR